MDKFITSMIIVICISLIFQMSKVEAAETVAANSQTHIQQETKATTHIVQDSNIQASDIAKKETVQSTPNVTVKDNVNTVPKVQTSAKAPVIKEVKQTVKVVTPPKKPVTKPVVKKPVKVVTTPPKKVTKVTPKAKTVKPVAKKNTKTMKPIVKKNTKVATKKVAPKKSATKKVKAVVKTSKKQPTKSNYYNQAPKAWSSKIPGSDNVRDFGQTTKASGINDALKIMKASGNNGVSISHTSGKAANIAMVFNWNPTAKALTYGTGTAIGKYTIMTANHVVNNQQAHKPLTPSKVENLRISLLQNGSKNLRTLRVIGVRMLQQGDVALLYTNEDISKYMKIRKIASEKSITNMKARTPIHMYHYGLPTGKYKKDPMGTMYHSKGKYSLMARNVNPIGYYQMMAEPGSSGGAVLNSKNEVIGVHAFRINSGDYKKYNLNTMAELRGKLRKALLKYMI